MSHVEAVSVERSDCPRSLPEWTDALITHVGRAPRSSWDLEETRCVPSGPPRFAGHIEAGTLGNVVLARVAASVPHDLVFSPRVSPSSAGGPIVLLFQVSGSCRLLHYDRSCMLYPGDWCLADTSHSLTQTFLNSPNSQIVLRLERPCDAELLAVVERAAARRWDATAGISRILRATLDEALHEMSCLRHHSETGLRHAVVEMAWSALRQQVEDPPLPGQVERQRSRVKSYIEDHLSDPNLSVETIASACAMSVRSLHRAFSAESSGSVTKYIWLRRLERCLVDLRNPGERRRSITEISYSWGFNSTSHFSRLFKSQFGVTPREYRSALECSVPRPTAPVRDLAGFDAPERAYTERKYAEGVCGSRRGAAVPCD